MKPASQLQKELPKIESLDKEFNEVEVSAHSFIRNGVLHVSAENGDSAADYYGEYRGGYPWINPRLESFAASVGAYWEWVNPGCISLHSK